MGIQCHRCFSNSSKNYMRWPALLVLSICFLSMHTFHCLVFLCEGKICFEDLLHFQGLCRAATGFFFFLTIYLDFTSKAFTAIFVGCSCSSRIILVPRFMASSVSIAWDRSKHVGAENQSSVFKREHRGSRM